LQSRRRKLAQIFAPPHESGHLIRFFQTVQSAPQLRLIAMFLGTKFALGPPAAQRFAAQLAGFHTHLAHNYNKAPTTGKA
jgi:hypothetical protein